MIISSTEQFESVLGLLRILYITQTSNVALGISRDFILYHGDDWTPCDGCNELMPECICPFETHYPEYDDEASY